MNPLVARAVLACYPREVRAAFGDEMAQLIADRSAERRMRGPRGRVALVMHLLSDTLRAAPRAHLDAWRRRRLAPQLPHLPSPREDRMDTLMQDLRYALRTLARRPAFTAVAVMTIMLGIGANTAIFSVVSAVLLRPLPYPDADRIAVLFGQRPGQPRMLVPILDMQDWKARNRTFEDIGMARTQSVNLTGTEAPDRLVGTFVSGNLFRILGAPVAVGRVFTDEESQVGAGQPVAVISNAAWRARFGGDSTILGRSLTLNGRPHVVIGVLAAGFRDPIGDVDVFMPISSANPAWFQRGNQNVWGFGKLKPGVTLAEGHADLERVARELEAEYPATNAGNTVASTSLKDQLVGQVRPSLLILLAFVGVVLLIACANVANLMLARSAARAREMSVRAALGAGGGRLVRQLLTESLLLSALGGLAGILAAHWAIKALVAAVPGGLPVFGDIGLDPRVLAFSAAITITAGLLFGAAPAFHAAKTDLHDALKARGVTSGPRRFDTRSVLVAAELALCIVLLVGAGLLTRSLGALTRVDTGLQRQGLLTAEFRLPPAKYGNDTLVNDFMERALAAIRAVPGAQSAALVMAIPFSGNWGSTNYATDLHPDVETGKEPMAQHNTSSDGAFATLGVRMLEGRDFTPADRMGAEPVVIVSEAMAKKEWPGQSALGHRVKIIGPPDVWATVIGVVGNIKQLTLGEPEGPQIWQPKPQNPNIFSSIAVRTEGDPMALAPAVRAALWSVDRDQPIWKMRTLESLIERDTASPKFTMMLTLSFAALALILAAIGVYGVMSYAVAQRTREVGIRMALGARGGEVVRLVLGRGVRIIVAASVAGLIVAFGAARLIKSQLFGVTTSDPLTFAGVPLILAAVAMLACYLPARRAARVDPVIALRDE